MSLLDHLNESLREQLLRYVGSCNDEKLKERLAEDVLKNLDKAVTKLGSKWVSGGPHPGDVVEVRDARGIILEPDDLGKPLYNAATGAISFTFILPGNPLLVLATTGRDAGKLRVMSTWSGDVGWIHLDNLRPF